MDSLCLNVARRIADRAISELPECVLQASGRALYSPISSLASGSPLYFLGINPGESKSVLDYHDKLTVRQDLERMRDGSAIQHAYFDESWDGQAPGCDTVQERGRHLFQILSEGTGLGAEVLFRKTPVSNFILVRSGKEEDLQPRYGKSKRKLALGCWPFHDAVIKECRCKVVLTHAIGLAREFAKVRKLGPLAERPSGWGGSLSTLYAWELPEGAHLLAIPNLSRYDPSGPRYGKLRAFFDEFVPKLPGTLA